MSEHDKPLDPWMRAAILAEGLDGGPSDAARSRMANKLAAALGLSVAALLGSGGGGHGGDGGGSTDGGGASGDGGGGTDGGGAGGDGGGASGDGGGDGGGGTDGGGASGGGAAAGAAGAGAGAAAGIAGTTIASKTAALVVGALIAGGGIGAAISELRPRSQPVVAQNEAREPRVVASETPDRDPDASSDPERDAKPGDTDATTPIDSSAIDAAASDRGAPMDAAPHVSHRDAAASDTSAPIDAAPREVHRDAAARDTAPAMTADELKRERQLIDVARSALRGGDLQLASKSLVEHGMRFPRGALVEEQRVLSIELLVAKGDFEGAKAKANAFRRDYPRSVFRARVDDIAPP